MSILGTHIATHWIIPLLGTFLLLRSLVGMLADQGTSFRIKIGITGVQIDWNKIKTEDVQDTDTSCNELSRTNDDCTPTRSN
ncbi:hypothetical protein [Actinokineospora cianjurensis]|uniref:Uncharacterized protein n=1 Tax=Actinokineospora cianjurensis TaxID=585224 RepID=A0A421BC28_9PSEU|nr:hypothetical protein [Actinokineospora cianjurensis]RLK61898.1 hypothetical protein CLV68_2443 [Actinokineospora cianjurensis]